MGEYVVMILSKYVVAIVANARKMNSKCLYTCIDELLIVCWIVQELYRKTTNTHDFVI